MSKLPAISGKQCIQALEKIGFVTYRQRGSHITLVRDEPQTQLTVPNHKTVKGSAILVDITSISNGIDFNITRRCIDRKNDANFADSKSIKAFPFSSHLFDVKFRKWNDALLFNYC